MTDDSVFPLAVRKVLFRRRPWSAKLTQAYMVGEHPWAGAGFNTERDAWKFFERFTSSMEYPEQQIFKEKP